MRLRIAPSPTGMLHLGNLYSIIVNAIFCSKYNSKLILRIEDTDSQRNKFNVIEGIYNVLDKIKINVDESPKRLGLYGPYKQSERLHIYKFYINKLLKVGGAFYCRCSFKRVNILKKINLTLGEYPTYDGKCLNCKYSTGKIRLKVPRIGVYIGNYKTKWSNVDMQVLWNNSKPTFHFANVIDDQLMKISHVIRGRDWLPSLPKQVLINNYLGFKTPKYYHIPLICDKNNLKLSKRFNDIDFNGLISLGIVSEAILRYLISIVVDDDVNNISEAAFSFNLGRLKQQSIQIDQKRLIVINGICLSEFICDINGFLNSLIQERNINRVIVLCTKKSLILHDIYKLMCFIFWNYKMVKMIYMSSIEYLLLNMLLVEYKKQTDWSEFNLKKLHEKLSRYLGLNIRTFCTILTIVIGGRNNISLYDAYVIIGQASVITRISLILEKWYHQSNQHI
ncbi:Glutamate--tRNA ligase [Candidatus Hodgkinia cicadicola]|uniref:Glutamate--tRNA ligase n=1 Tax=Candidatus Hodgkinia cicadicola TaxID=573658 RepID=A0ABX4MGC6_9HYPH|nr:Glutamate--tRNA ligase [Candidatus Hodgkinia cicadicola]PIM96015.1 Glutamate--tRNA ligase [Candidatus Hodgkinia cicadicola]